MAIFAGPQFGFQPVAFQPVPRMPGFANFGPGPAAPQVSPGNNQAMQFLEMVIGAMVQMGQSWAQFGGGHANQATGITDFATPGNAVNANNATGISDGGGSGNAVAFGGGGVDRGGGIGGASAGADDSASVGRGGGIGGALASPDDGSGVFQGNGTIR